MLTIVRCGESNKLGLVVEEYGDLDLPRAHTRCKLTRVPTPPRGTKHPPALPCPALPLWFAAYSGPRPNVRGLISVRTTRARKQLAQELNVFAHDFTRKKGLLLVPAVSLFSFDFSTEQLCSVQHPTRSADRVLRSSVPDLAAEIAVVSQKPERSPHQVARGKRGAGNRGAGRVRGGVRVVV